MQKLYYLYLVLILLIIIMAVSLSGKAYLDLKSLTACTNDFFEINSLVEKFYSKLSDSSYFSKLTLDKLKDCNAEISLVVLDTNSNQILYLPAQFKLRLLKNGSAMIDSPSDIEYLNSQYTNFITNVKITNNSYSQTLSYSPKLDTFSDKTYEDIRLNFGCQKNSDYPGSVILHKTQFNELFEYTRKNNTDLFDCVK